MERDSLYVLDMKGKPAFSRSSSTALLSYTNKSTVRSLPETKDCYAVDLTLNSNATQLAVLTVPLTIQLFDASTLTPVTTLSSTSNSFDASDSSSTVKITSIQFATISPHTIFASTNKNLVLGWDTRTPQQETFQLQGCADEHKFLSVTCNSEDQLIAAGSELKGDENVAIAFWDVRAPSTKQLLGYYTESHSDDILQVKFSRMNAKKLISGSTDGLVCLYDVSQANEEDALEQVSVGIDEKLLAQFVWSIGLQRQWICIEMRFRSKQHRLCHNSIECLLHLVHHR